MHGAYISDFRGVGRTIFLVSTPRIAIVMQITQEVSMLSESARGVYIISVTPFDERGALDLDGTDRLIDFYVEAGANGLTILGVMGEAPKLAHQEAVDFARRVIARAGKLPVVVGVSAPGLASLAALTKAVMDLGAAGVMIAPPGVLKGDDAIITYFENCVETIGPAPFALQDFPQASGLFIPVSVIERIAAICPTFVMLKHEDWPGLDKITAVRAREKHGMRRLSILSGNCGIFLPFELARGVDGAMTGYAFPEMLVDVCRLMSAGRRSEAHDLFDAHLPLVRYEQQPSIGLAVRKYVLRRRGVLKSDAQRRPGPSVSRETAAEIDFMLERLERAIAPRKLRAAS
jgi:4-hydroxy-tetrahydrodipicolinate synthase